jgi:hypothetical protein
MNRGKSEMPMTPRRTLSLLPALLPVLLVVACSSSEPEAPVAAAANSPIEQPPPTSQPPPVALVNGEPIVEADVQFAMSRLVVEPGEQAAPDTLRRTVIESLVTARAMRAVIEPELGQAERDALARQAAAYLDELYVQRYLRSRVTVKPVTSTMVEDYYARHQDEFGGGTVPVVELLGTQDMPTEDERDRFLAIVARLHDTPDWSAVREASGLNLRYRTVSVHPGLLDPSLEQAARELTVGEVSEVVMVDGAPSVMRLVRIDTVPARPLAEVSAEIRQRLAARQLADAIKEAGGEALSQVAVEYPHN